MKKNTFKEIIEFAIENEVEAYEFYDEAAKKVKDSNLKDTFAELAKEELEHKSFLENFLAGDFARLELNEKDIRADYKVADGIERPQLSVDMTFKDAIALAIKNEQEAMDLYANLAEVCSVPEHHRLFLDLVEMERSHKTRLEEMYVNVAYAEVW